MTLKSTRQPGKMPLWQRCSFWVLMGVCCMSGFSYLIGTELLTAPSIYASRQVITTHGISACLTVFLFGTISMGHIRLGWILGKNKSTGMGNVFTLSLLILTGLGLYYGSEEIRDLVVVLHWLAGFGFILVLILHLLPFDDKRKQLAPLR